MTPRELVLKWREDADILERYDSREADSLRKRADELDVSLASLDDFLLDLKAAARESGYSPDRLRHMVADKVIPNAGKPGRPRIRRGDLPKKPRARRNTFNAQAIASDLLGSRQ